MSGRARVAATFVAGLVVIAGVLAGLLVQSPRRVIATNRIIAASTLAELQPHTAFCQGEELVPAGTEALRVSAGAYIGPAVSVRVSRGAQTLARARRDSGWVSSSLTLPLTHTIATSTDATICLTRGNGRLAAAVFGGEAPRGLSPASVNGRALPGRMRVEYLGRGNRSWLSLARYVARRMGLGHAPSGGWVVLPLAAMMLIAVTLAGWLMMREQAG